MTMPENLQRTEGEVPETVLLSVCIITYNHERYIRETLDSVLAQQTNFPFEICIGEDQSTDKTREICLEYAANFPEQIRLFLRDEKDKIYIDGIKTGRFNGVATRKAARGKYIALCEGDDFWTDPSKLQKQVDILEAKPFLSACVHRAKVFAESMNWREEIFPEMPTDGTLGVLDALNHQKMFAATASLIYRKFEEPSQEWTLRCYMGDRMLFAALAARGPIVVLPDVMSVYRRHDRGACADFQHGKRAFLGLRARLVYFRNIGDIVGDAPEVEAKRIEMLRYFTRQYVKTCLRGPGLDFSERLKGLKVGLWGWGYLTTLLTRKGGGWECLKMGRVLLGACKFHLIKLLGRSDAIQK